MKNDIGSANNDHYFQQPARYARANQDKAALGSPTTVHLYYAICPRTGTQRPNMQGH